MSYKSKKNIKTNKKKSKKVRKLRTLKNKKFIYGANNKHLFTEYHSNISKLKKNMERFINKKIQ